MDSKIANFFYPKSICLVGASTKEKSLGYELLKTLKGYNYTGKMFPVNPKADEVLGFKCYRTIEEIEEQIDLAIIMVPKQFADAAIDTLISKNVKSMILITAGFKEVGKEGEEAEQRLLKKIKDAGVRMVGPNCMGVINTLDSTKLNATFVAERPETGNLGFLSQSGALAAAVLNSLRETDIRFGHFISVGNKADMNENDFMSFWHSDDNIKILTLYLESFVDGENFIKPYIKSDITKPTIIIKAGRTESGMKAASSHTGALSAKDAVVDAILNQFGIIRADNVKELFNTAKGFENFPMPKGNRIALVTNSGGPGILAVDNLEKEGLKLAELSDNTKAKLKEIVHPEGSVNNPVDLLPGGTAETYKRVCEIFIEDENVDAIISIFVEPVMVPALPVIEAINDIENEKPIFQAVMPLPEFWQNYRENSKKRLPLFRTPEDPSEVIANMLFHKKAKQRLLDDKNEYLKMLSIKPLNNNYNKGFISQQEVAELSAKYSLPIIKDYFLKPDELKNFSEDIYPVVLKGINKEVVHKSELGAVQLNINSKEDLLAAAEKIEASFSAGNYAVEEFMIQSFIKQKHEVLLGGYRDQSFGPLLMFGTGGKYVEVMQDTSIKSAYIAEHDIDDMLNSTKMGQILHGVRGEKHADLAKLKEIIKSCAKMLIENPNIAEFDLNPLIVAEDNSIHTVDIRVRID
ncbi:acetate--CoA ligase family protein [Bacteroidota bacterium]